MQSPAPVAKNIRRGGSERSASGGDDEEFEAIDIIENIEAITDQDQLQVNTGGEDSSSSTITEDNIESPRTGGDSIQVQEVGNTRNTHTDRIGVDLSSDSNSTSSSSSSSSTTGSDKSDSDSSSSSSDSDCYYSDSDDSDKSNYKYKYKMSSSMNKSPICNGSRAGFEEWHSKWEVFGQDNRFDEYQSIIPHPDLPVNGYLTDPLSKSENKAMKKNKKAISSLRISFSTTYTVDMQ